ncbi:DUF5642 family protein [Mycobacterium heidelbergense]|uniref:DUF5642 domain-containing protein n=1 Tax=Mycobacterium heidelbergense TaxID=53376 RepID=A0A1X0DH51_MYCHE|nr:DUF5642 family protein [Mycobacterium heidelbergense]MCV7051551.1 DUF5642 family protein [Mycobacterium heidelbergense]ORA71698.1 hypothetical protein BST25_16150 [Mycobacterium heidelbergense]
MLKVVLAIVSMCALAGCSGTNASSTKADISKVDQVKSSFGSEFKVNDIAKRGIDPKFFSAHKLPPGLIFAPPECAKVAVGPEMPMGLGGTMAGLSAEGNGNRLTVIAMETSQPLPSNDPGHHCSKVVFSGPQMKGSIEAVDAPRIDGMQTLGERRVMQTDSPEGDRSLEAYRYTAQFGDYEVVVIASPTMNPDQPAVPIDTQRARDLLVKAVAAIRS